MNEPVLPDHDDPPGCWLLILAGIALFCAGALAASALLIAQGSLRAEASHHVEP
jgi:hypothetical protein